MDHVSPVSPVSDRIISQQSRLYKEVLDLGLEDRIIDQVNTLNRKPSNIRNRSSPYHNF